MINLDELSIDQLKILLVDESLKAEQVSKNIELIRGVLVKRISGDEVKEPQSPGETKVSSPQETK